jgi:predicted permease
MTDFARTVLESGRSPARERRAMGENGRQSRIRGRRRWHDSRQHRGVMETLFQDLRYALRTLWRTPGWTAMAVLTLALGTGANAAVFSFVDALLFRMAPGMDPARPLVAVYTSDFSSGLYGGSSYPDFESFKTETTAFARLAAIDDSAAATLRVGDDLQRVRVARVTGEYFEALGVRPSPGRPLTAADAAASSPPVAVIGDALWRRAFGAEPAMIGTTIMLNGRPFTIVGVAPPRFAGIDAGRSIEIWTPLTREAGGERGDRGYKVLGHLRDGVSIGEARAQLAALGRRLAQDYPESNLGTLERPKEPRPFAVMPATRINPQQRGQVAMVAGVLMGGVGLVLLLACANVASLLLSRTTTRAREIAVRRALGASGPRLLRQLLTESAVLAFASAALAMIFAAWTADVLPSFFPAEQAAALDVSPGLRVGLFALALSAMSALLVGILPAVRAVRPPLAASLRGAAGDITERTASRSRTVLVVAQVAIASLLLVTAALLAQSVSNQLHADLGFSTRQALLATVDVPLGEKKGAVFFEQARDRIAALPGVADAAWTRTLPLAGSSRRGFTPEAYVPRDKEDLELNYTIVSADYFRTLGIQVLAGRGFEASDHGGEGDEASARVVVVNEALAKRFFHGAAVGRRLIDSGGTKLEIVGVVRSGKYRTVSEEAPPFVYYPLGQMHSPRMSLIVRAAAPERLAEAVRREIRAASGEVPVFRVMSLQAHIEEALSAERLSASLVTACGLLSAVLAIVGLYGAVAYLVARRTREIGVRVALGAQPRHVLTLVVRHGLVIACGGITIGLVGAAAFAALLQSMLYGITPTNPATHAGVALVLGVVALLAAYVPARRAVRIDPARALAHD